jgi:hypothetical protein
MKAYFMTLLHNNYTGILQVHDVATPVVSNVFDSSGELIAGVASVGAVVRFLPHNVYCCLKMHSASYELLLFYVAFSIGQEKFLTPSWLYRFRHHISNAPLVMLDANLPPDSLEAACISKLFRLKFCREIVYALKISCQTLY